MKLPAFVLAFVASCAGCGTVGRHYASTSGSVYSSSEGADGRSIVEVRVDSRPTGAMILVNGNQVGPGPVLVRLPVSEHGILDGSVEISADYGNIVPNRGGVMVAVAHFRRGDLLPKSLMLARPADGGVQSFGGSPPGL